MSSNIYDIKINEEYTQLAPKYSEREFNDIVESIRTNGQRYAIVASMKTHEILDGHHRFKACQKLGIEPKVEFREFETPLDEKLFVYDTNYIRRNLNDFQKAEMLYQKEKLLVEVARANSLANLKKGNDYSPTRPNGPLGTVAVKVTQGSGQSPTTYKRAKYIIENGTECQKLVLRSGKSEINTIYKQIQNEKTRQELIKNAKGNPTLELSDSCKLLHGDFREKLKDIPDNSIDIIFTDQPYKKEDLPVCRDLAAFAARLLKPGGSLILYTGGYGIPEVIDYIENAGLKYWFDIFVKLYIHIEKDNIDIFVL
jgi:SAM-dependent methyltransferase